MEQLTYGTPVRVHLSSAIGSADINTNIRKNSKEIVESQIESVLYKLKGQGNLLWERGSISKTGNAPVVAPEVVPGWAQAHFGGRRKSRSSRKKRSTKKSRK